MMSDSFRRLMALAAVLVLLFTFAVPVSASNHEKSITIYVENAPSGVIYLDLLSRDIDTEMLTPHEESEAYNELRSLESQGWYPVTVWGVEGVNGSLESVCEGDYTVFKFTGEQLPHTYRIIAASQSGYVSVSEIFLNDSNSPELYFDFYTGIASKKSDSVSLWIKCVVFSVIALIISISLLKLYKIRFKREFYIPVAVAIITQIYFASVTHVFSTYEQGSIIYVIDACTALIAIVIAAVVQSHFLRGRSKKTIVICTSLSYTLIFLIASLLDASVI